MRNQLFYHPLTATPFKRNISYTELAPCEELRPYVRCYWGTEKSLTKGESNNAPEIVIPDTCVDIIYYINDTDHTVSGGFCGINDRSFYVPEEADAGHAVATFAIRFYAWSAYAFAGDSLRSTMNGYLEAGAIFEWLDKLIRPKLPELKTLRERTSFTEQLLLKKLSDVKENKVINRTIQNILRSKGSLEVSDLAKESFVSTRQLERLFHEYIGITPKKLSNLIRYQFLWRDILCEKNFDVLNAVHKYGYTDQSHLLREFKRYHSMDIHRAREMAFHDVENIQDMFK
ncbi:MAG: helix-turn-helix domain-containing protein [Lachnospiraceae bacterium]|nr:helix-turn-helix domain-containing protein [Lachnospiraceae bacterium]